uniref:Phosducin domain-containing protein n=1 Tax=Rhodosorus marinus TaxID=101924 RepID=A0A7S2ZHG7_9RHOD|mmetsp:Transcript_19216/g.76974  ORF Transcript_19216/g.76974 Transcript_19216/m.76974 type:complete len:227 (+) Transcript_19216:1101-1781(+)|eukprot:CAMPEP_0113960600 /NCGR_PEP_ID=MMETSP0011_2-20120614/4809_1 /TAXON_ID=101924 /ORGANISM="Rhodosorus marinus" /LENGTH=226 /DNA_ID=CAMNT_0000972079 /DNA_START=367 /DNA_END=1047 /DNA_ORIENTATION=- /assembly_acc=CAM_ASM_000156
MAALGTGGAKETTEWEEILKEKGIIPEKTQEEIAEEQLKTVVEESVARYDPNASKTVEELDEDLEDADSEEERILMKHRERRMMEMRAAQSRKQFSPGVHYISAADWKPEVSEAGPDFHIVVLLFQEGTPKSALMEDILLNLSQKFKHTKFVKCKATDAIANYPDEKIPTVLVYYNGIVKKNFVGLGAFKGLKTDADDVEWELGKLGAVETDMEEAPEKSFSFKRV